MSDPEAAFWRIVAANWTRDETNRLRMIAAGWVKAAYHLYGYGYQRW